MKHLSAIAVCGLLAGCAAVPLQVTLFTQAVDGVSYLETGKSISDHLLSAALDRDCAMLRIVEGENLCIDSKARTGLTTASAVTQVAANSAGNGAANGDVGDPVVLPADIATLGADSAGVARGAPDANGSPAPIVAAFSSEGFFSPEPIKRAGPRPGASEKAPAKTPEKASDEAAAPETRAAMPPAPDVEPAAGPATARPMVQTLRPAPVPVPQSGLGVANDHPTPVTGQRREATSRPGSGLHYFVVLGSYSRKSNARRAAERKGRGARVAGAVVKGRRVWRVIVGPFDRARASAQRDWLRSNGGARSAWVIRSCAVAAGTCIATADIAR